MSEKPEDDARRDTVSAVSVELMLWVDRLKDENRTLRAELTKVVEDYEAELQRVHGLFDRMAAIMEEVQWAGYVPGKLAMACVMCKQHPFDGHAPDCRLKAAIG